MKFLRKLTASLLLTALLACCLAGCGSSSYAEDSYSVSSTESYDSAAASDDYYYDIDTEEAAYESSGTTAEDSAEALITGTQETDLSQKLIYTAYAQIETKDYEGSVAAIQTMLSTYGAFLESSETYGNSYESQYYGYSGGRSATFVIRVPKDNYAALTGALDTVGNVTSLNSSVENITEQYTDVDSRLETYRTEESRLLAMLEKAETVEDMIAIEERLSDVRYNIESLTAQLRNWDNEINYSTVTISLQEVEELTETVPVQRTYGEKLRDGLSDSLSGIGKFFSNFFLWLVSALPVLILLAVIAFVIILLVRLGLRRHRAKKSEKRSEENTVRFNPDDGTPVEQEMKDE